MLLSEKKVIITGGSVGMGKAIAAHFVKQGAHIVICSRSSEQLLSTQNELEALRVHAEQTIDSFRCDVADEQSVSELFKHSISKLKGLDVLINNAGVYGPKGPSETVDIDEWKQAIEINLYGPLFTSREAIPIFKEQRSGKIINLSGGGATAPLPNISAYAASKAALVRLTETLSEENKSWGIDINAIAPGALNTRLLDEVLEAGPEKVGEGFYQKALQQQKSGGAPLQKGADLCAYLASNQSDGITGKLLSALWDGWNDFDAHLDDIKGTDIFTLRRIIPKERNMDWE